MTNHSIKPRKQRIAIDSAPNHRRRILSSAPLSSELRSRFGRRSYPVRKGDTVRVSRGDFKGIEGKVTEVDRKNYRLYIEGVVREKVAGTQKKVSIHPSKVLITGLNLDDDWRADVLKSGKKASEASEGAA